MDLKLKEIIEFLKKEGGFEEELEKLDKWEDVKDTLQKIMFKLEEKKNAKSSSFLRGTRQLARPLGQIVKGAGQDIAKDQTFKNSVDLLKGNNPTVFKYI